jgi:hypothetical protein
VARTVVSQAALDHILNKKRLRRPNIIIYRDIVGANYRAPGAFLFIPKVKVIDGQEPNELFTVFDNASGIPVWIERGLLNSTSPNDSFIVDVERGLFKRLKVEMSSKQVGRV